MSDSEIGNSVVLATSSRCPQHPCPFLHLNLSHTASEENVLQRCREATLATRLQFRNMATSYITLSSAARVILEGMGSTAKLPVALSAQELLGAEMCAEFAEAIVAIGDPSRPPPSRGVKRAYSAGADGGYATVGTTATGSESTTTRKNRYMDADEYPQWQFKSGQQKRTWTAYDRVWNERLEEAHSLDEHTVLLEIDGWRYLIYLVGNFRQLSLGTDSWRDVRRLTGPPADAS